MFLKKYPVSMCNIIAMEFNARLAFCGISTLLTLYLRNELLLPEDTATVVYHVFIMICYVVPILGAVLADGCLGRFQTILYFLTVCALGNILEYFATMRPVDFNTILWTMIGLTLIAVGAGGIKPCVAAFGGDQFRLPDDEKRLQSFFSIFYFTANLGGLVGMLLTPLLRKAVSCGGKDYCYSLAFGVPAAAMVVAVVVFAIGKPLYTLKSTQKNVMGKFFGCILYAAINRRRNTPTVKRHWLDNSEGKYDRGLIRDMKTVFRIFLLFVPLPIFWSLLVQQGSQWTFQATRMNCKILGIQLLPDQIQAIGPAIVLLLIPVFNKFLYRSFKNSRFLGSPLQRMYIGGLMAAMSFICAGLLETKLQDTYSILPTKKEANVIFINTLPCDLIIGRENYEESTVPSGKFIAVRNIPALVADEIEFKISPPLMCGDTGVEARSFIRITVIPGETTTTVLAPGLKGTADHYTLKSEDLQKPLSGRPKLRLIFIRVIDSHVGDSSVTIYDSEDSLVYLYLISKDAVGLSNYTELQADRYKYYVTYADQSTPRFEGFLQLEEGGAYSLVIRGYNQEIKFAENLALTPPNHVPIAWMFPQYFFISVAEVLFAISGLEFCFTQAPRSMKTVTLAAWYFTVACGNLLVIAIKQLPFCEDQADEFFVFTVLILLDMALFRWMCSKYHRTASEISPRLSVEPESEDSYPLLGNPSRLAVH